MTRRAMPVAIGLTMVTAAFVPASAEQHHHWSYSGEGGPSHWAELDTKNAACGEGKSQSPVNIRIQDVRRTQLPKLMFNYRTTSLHIIDNGHSVQINVEPGSVLKVGDMSYQLLQLHFHHPSEELINGKRSEMVAHLVHRGTEGKLAVVAVLLRAGQPNSTVEALWNHLPKQKEREAYFKDVLINPAGLLPMDRSYFTYTGSLTTPPCSEGVRWLVLRSPSTLSKHEIAVFSKLYPNDARPVQKLNGRQVLGTK
ncbi:carbonic anhydrase family protein [Sphingomonas sp. SM33]|uniref:carbonic anhydrase n=1 Tax=Sphingomonas telluris TaxID=2907998 RepID=A0ABS9VIP3_9SPHN|nr:carbonic anhydrase family protein [Sphingomonas telluris]MCH8614851.1 carbonic anhydrase family protein [Sphingomonas telluris]